MKTAGELGIETWEHTQLQVVRDMLRNGIIREDTGESPTLPMAFDMAETADTNECGAVCCIGGWMYALEFGHKESGGVLRFEECEASRYVSGNQEEQSPLHRLFFATDRGGYSMSDVTPAIAADAIDNLLNTGDPQFLPLLDAFHGSPGVDGTEF